MNKVTVGLINSTATVLLQYRYSVVCPPVLQNAWNVKKKKKKKWKRRRNKVQCYPNEHYIVPRASPTGFHISSYFTISRSYFINYNILFYHIPSIQKLYYFTILLKYYFLIFFLLFLFFSSLFSLSASTSSKSIPSKITRRKSQQKFTQIKQAPELNNLNL